MARTAVIALIACACAMWSTGCATLIASGPDEFPIRTEPPGAYVYVDGKVVGQTPLVVSLDRNKSLGDIRIYYPGFKQMQFRRYKSFNNWTIGSIILIAMIVPIVVDIATGNWMAFDDSGIELKLIPGQSTAPYGLQPTIPTTDPR